MLKLATKFRPEPQAFETAIAAGFQHAEFWLGAEFLRETDIAEIAEKYPLTYALHCPNRGDLDADVLWRMVELYRRLDIKALVIHQPMYRRYAAALRELEPNIRLGVENHRLDLEELDQWAAENDWLTLDVEHLWKFTLKDVPLESLLEHLHSFLKSYAEKVIHVHLPGYWPGNREHRPMRSAPEMIRPVFSLLAEFQFPGLVVSEADSEFQTLETLRQDVELYNSWLAEQQPESAPTAARVELTD